MSDPYHIRCLDCHWKAAEAGDPFNDKNQIRVTQNNRWHDAETVFPYREAIATFLDAANQVNGDKNFPLTVGLRSSDDHIWDISFFLTHRGHRMAIVRYGSHMNDCGKQIPSEQYGFEYCGRKEGHAGECARQALVEDGEPWPTPYQILSGWTCTNLQCGVFNGEAKERRSHCRVCGRAR